MLPAGGLNVNSEWGQVSINIRQRDHSETGSMYCIIKCIVQGKETRVKNVNLRHPSCTVVMWKMQICVTRPQCVNDGCVTLISQRFYSVTVSTLMIQTQRPRSTLAVVWSVGARFFVQVFHSTTCRQFNWAGLPLNQHHWGGGDDGCSIQNTVRRVLATSRSRCQYQVKHGFLGSRVQLKCDGTRLRMGGEVKGKLANGAGSQYPSHYLGTWCNQHYY